MYQYIVINVHIKSLHMYINCHFSYIINCMQSKTHEKMKFKMHVVVLYPNPMDF